MTNVRHTNMDADRKKDLKAAWKQAEQQKLIDSIPIPQKDLRDLFDFLDRENAPACDHTLKETREFLTSRGHDPEKIIPWLQEYGGYCDCEVIYNVDDKFGEIVGR